MVANLALSFPDLWSLLILIALTLLGSVLCAQRRRWRAYVRATASLRSQPPASGIGVPADTGAGPKQTDEREQAQLRSALPR